MTQTISDYWEQEKVSYQNYPRSRGGLEDKMIYGAIREFSTLHTKTHDYDMVTLFRSITMLRGTDTIS